MNTDRAWLRPPTADGPARHEVTRLVADPADLEPGHSHVIAVETASGDGGRRWSLVEFVWAVRLGERFSLRQGTAMLEVEPTVCDRCSRITIATTAPAHED